MAINQPTTNIKNPNCCASAFGRIFYAVDSTVLYSQLLVSPKEAGRCYQDNDPTSEALSDLLATDGGIIPLEEAVGIKAIKPFKSGVLVFATNGVWYIYNSDGGFKATGFNIAKVSERGLESVRSVVEAEGSMYYFSNNGIMEIVATEFDVLNSVDISAQTVRSYFLTSLSGKNAHGVYDEAQKQIVWLVPNFGQFLIYDLEVQAFYPQMQANDDYVSVRPFRINNAVLYPFYTQTATKLNYTVAQPKNASFEDFGENAPSFLVSGWETLGKFANSKKITRAKFYFNKTETEVLGYENGQYSYTKPSACYLQTRWDFDNSDAYSKWVGIVDGKGRGNINNIYLPNKRGFLPTSYPHTMNTGESLVSYTYGIRGKGDAVQFVFQTEPEKDLQLLGYSVSFSMGGRT